MRRSLLSSQHNMGKVPLRLKEVVYTVSPFEVTILNGLFKDFPKKVHKNLSEVGYKHACWPCKLLIEHYCCLLVIIGDF